MNSVAHNYGNNTINEFLSKVFEQKGWYSAGPKATEHDEIKIKEFRSRIETLLSTPLSSKKRMHHYVPECMQKAFSIPGQPGSVYRLDTRYGHIKPTSVSGALREEHLYKGSAIFGETDNRLEDVFAAIESAAGPIFKRASAEPFILGTDLTTYGTFNREILSWFIAAMLMRTPAFKRFLDKRLEALKQLSEAQFKGLIASMGFSIEALCTDTSKVAQELGWDALKVNTQSDVFATIYKGLDWIFLQRMVLAKIAELVHNSSWSFWIIPENLKASFILPDFPMVKSIDIPGQVLPFICPLSKNMLLEVHNQPAMNLETCNREGVRHFNELLVLAVDIYVVSSSDTLLRSLFRIK